METTDQTPPKKFDKRLKENQGEPPMTTHEKARKLVDREVHLCLSSLVDDLVKVYHRAMSAKDEFGYKPQPLPWDYEDEILMLHRPVEIRTVGNDGEEETEEHEIFEHWAVSNWLGEKLRDEGERVVEFANLHIWCRTTTGQMIAADGVFERIAEETFS